MVWTEFIFLQDDFGFVLVGLGSFFFYGKKMYVCMYVCVCVCVCVYHGTIQTKAHYPIPSYNVNIHIYGVLVYDIQNFPCVLELYKKQKLKFSLRSYSVRFELQVTWSNSRHLLLQQSASIVATIGIYCCNNRHLLLQQQASIVALSVRKVSPSLY